MKTMNLSILALAFFGMSTLASAQSTDNVDAQTSATAQKADKKPARRGFGFRQHREMNDSAVADFMQHRREMGDSLKANNKGRRPMMGRGNQMRRPAQARNGRGAQMWGRNGMNRPGMMAMGGRRGGMRQGAGRGMMGMQNFAFQAPRDGYASYVRAIELTDELKANMTKKELKKYNKAMKRAQKEMAKAQEGLKEARDQRKKADAIVIEQLHKAKRYTQKANRIAMNQIISMHNDNGMA